MKPLKRTEIRKRYFTNHEYVGYKQTVLWVSAALRSATITHAIRIGSIEDGVHKAPYLPNDVCKACVLLKYEDKKGALTFRLVYIDFSLHEVLEIIHDEDMDLSDLISEVYEPWKASLTRAKGLDTRGYEAALKAAALTEKVWGSHERTVETSLMFKELRRHGKLV